MTNARRYNKDIACPLGGHLCDPSDIISPEICGGSMPSTPKTLSESDVLFIELRYADADNILYINTL